jgi:hypothetical protein
MYFSLIITVLKSTASFIAGKLKSMSLVYGFLKEAPQSPASPRHLRAAVLRTSSTIGSCPVYFILTTTRSGECRFEGGAAERLLKNENPPRDLERLRCDARPEVRLEREALFKPMVALVPCIY